MSTVTVMSRSNLTVQGRLITVGEVVTLDATDEVQGLINMKYVVAQNDDGSFTDYGPLNGYPTPPGVRCCGG